MDAAVSNEHRLKQLQKTTMVLLLALVVSFPILLATSIPQTVFTATQARPLIPPETARYAQELIERWNSSGLSIAVIAKDPTSPNGWRSDFGGYGVARQDGAQVNVDTLFDIGSNSKLFTAVSVGLLIANATLARETGRQLSWTTRMHDLIPEWGLMDETASHHATIQDPLSHRTGLPRHELAAAKRPGGIREAISKLRHLRPSAEFRETYQYNNHMYETLAYLPQLLLNQSYESYVDQHIFQPLGMLSSTMSVAKAEKSGNLAHGYQWDSRDISKGIPGTLRPTIPYATRPGNEDILMGAGGVLTSARDLTMWLSMLMNNGRHPYTNQTVIPESVLTHITYGRVVSSGVPTFPEMSPVVYGGAQLRYTYQGHEVIEHGGVDLGFTSQISRFPQDGLGILVLSNDGQGTNPIVENIKFRIADDILGLKHVDWNERFEQAFQQGMDSTLKTVTPRPSSPRETDWDISLLGQTTFSHPTYGTLEPCLVPQTVPLYNRVSWESTTGDIHRLKQCAAMLASPSAQRIISQSNLTIPTFIVAWNRAFSTHLRLTHFNHNVFNATSLWTNADTRERERYGRSGDGGDVLVHLDGGFEVEWVRGEAKAGQGIREGLAFRQFWGHEGPDARLPVGEGEEGAEVWFGSG